MALLNENDSPDKHLRYCRHLNIRLAGRPEAAEVRAEVQDRTVALKAAIEAHEEAVENRVCASAEVEVPDTLVDQALASLVLAVEHQVGGDREDPRFLAAFPSAPSAASMGIATDTQRDYVTSALAVLGEDKTLTGIGPLLDALKAHQNALESALRIREAFFGVEATASARLKVATLQARNAHNEALPKLQVVVPRQKALVKSFFTR